ncbi:MAG: vWA domain-containing protein [Micavibrio sp.]
MDEGELKNLLGQDIPTPDQNARKRALNLALAEYEATKTDPQNSFQGFSFWSRLTGRTNENPRREKMNKKLVYGGMATAMVVVLAAGASLTQFNAPIQQPVIVGGKVSEVYARALQEVNQSAAERALNSAESSLPVPAGAPSGKVAEMKMAPSAAPTARMEMSADSSFVGGIAQSQLYPAEAPQYAYQDQGRDKFADFEENPVKLVKAEPVSTFSVDVDTASYSFMRRQLNAGVLPQKDAVRIEEMVNYFDYDYALPDTKAEPFKPSVTVTPSPWAEGHKLVHIGIKGYDIAQSEKPRSNLVFLLDTSGSMDAPDKLPLLKNSLKMLLDTMNADDTVAIVSYAGSAGTVLEPTKASDKAKIIAALDNLGAGGSTAGAEGIRQAYQLAKSGFDKNAVNRVILATDGDFNVGITNPEELKDFVERERDSGIFLSVLGFGQGNLNDQMMQTLAQNGNGVAAYIDTLGEARKVLVEEASSTLFTIAKDVKIQVEFNPATVAEYRLVGYETRALNREDFNNDTVDAGDIGAGHAVTAIYDITPVGAPRSIDDNRYAAVKVEESKANADFGSEYAFLKIRYKLPDEDTSKLITTPITTADEKPFASTICPPNAQCLVADTLGASDDVRFAVAVAGFGQLLKGGKHTGSLTYDDVIAMAQGAKGTDEFGYRAEFIQLVRLAKSAPALPDTQP